MQELIDHLHSEHNELQQALAGVRPRSFRAGEGPARLRRVRELLRRHISRERERLYPPLEAAARENAELADRLRLLGDDLRIVSDLAEEFVNKYTAKETAESLALGNARLIEFATDHGALLTILRIRLRREEEQLFPLYSALIRN